MKWYQKSALVLVLLTAFLCIGGMTSCNSSTSSISSTTSTTTKAVVTTTIATIATETTLQTSAAKEIATLTVTTAAAEPIDMPAVTSGVLRVHYLDVGQADSAFIELPDGTTMLIDAGNKGDGSNVVSYIKNLGYNTIDYLVATHPHEDHIGGMATVINSFNIGQIYMPKVASTTQAFEGLLTTIQDKGYTINTAQAGVQIAPGINILSPGVGSDYGDELNDWSAVISVVYGSKTFLFMGDAGTTPESAFTIDADVVKISHHGSRTAYSSSFYKELSPTIAIISVGSDNSYGLPDEEVLKDLIDIGTTVYRTDENGTIVLESDGSTITAKSIGVTVSPVLPTVTTKPTTAAPVATTKETTAATTTAAETQAPVIDTGSDNVFITNTGSKYHRDGCRYLDESKIGISKADAIAQGYDACKVCDP